MNGDDLMTATRFGRLWSVLDLGLAIADVDARVRELRYALYALPASDLIDLGRLVSLALTRSVTTICSPADAPGVRVIAGVVAGLVVGRTKSLDVSEICDVIDSCLNPSRDDPDPFVPAQIVFALGLPDSAKSEIARTLVGPPSIVDIVEATTRELGWRGGSSHSALRSATNSAAAELFLAYTDSRDGPAVEISVVTPTTTFVLATETNSARAVAIATAQLDSLAGN